MLTNKTTLKNVTLCIFPYCWVNSGTKNHVTNTVLPFRWGSCINPISTLIFWPCVCSLGVKLSPYFISDRRMPKTWHLAQILSTVCSLKEPLKPFLLTSAFFRKNCIIFTFTVLLYFLYFLYYLLSRLTQIPFYSLCKMREGASSANNNVR